MTSILRFFGIRRLEPSSSLSRDDEDVYEVSSTSISLSVSTSSTSSTSSDPSTSSASSKFILPDPIQAHRPDIPELEPHGQYKDVFVTTVDDCLQQYLIRDLIPIVFEYYHMFTLGNPSEGIRLEPVTMQWARLLFLPTDEKASVSSWVLHLPNLNCMWEYPEESVILGYDLIRGVSMKPADTRDICDRLRRAKTKFVTAKGDQPLPLSKPDQFVTHHPYWFGDVKEITSIASVNTQEWLDPSIPNPSVTWLPSVEEKWEGPVDLITRKMTGNGIWTSPNASYKGVMKNGEMHGKGVMLQHVSSECSQWRMGDWGHNEFVHGTFVRVQHGVPGINYTTVIVRHGYFNKSTHEDEQPPQLLDECFDTDSDAVYAHLPYAENSPRYALVTRSKECEWECPCRAQNAWPSKMENADFFMDLVFEFPGVRQEIAKYFE